jgi:hypothetical protein
MPTSFWGMNPPLLLVHKDKIKIAHAKVGN